MTSTLQEVSQVQSLAAIRNLIRVAVSCVTYLRGLCDDNSYQTRQFLGLQLRQLSRTSPEAGAISRWLEEGAFDALNKGFLRELSLCVYDAGCSQLLESYTFGIRYSEDGSGASVSLLPVRPSAPPPAAVAATRPGVTPAAGCPGLDPCGAARGAAEAAVAPRGLPGSQPPKRRKYCRQEVQQMLLSIITKLMHVVESLPPLTCPRVLLMRLAYYDSRTPPTYEPPCFSRGSDAMAAMYQAEMETGAAVADMQTSYHAMSVSIRHPFCSPGVPRIRSGRPRLDGLPDRRGTPPTDGANDWHRPVGTLGGGGRRPGSPGSRSHPSGAAHPPSPAKDSAGRRLHAPPPGTAPRDDGAAAEDMVLLVFTAFVVSKCAAVAGGRVSLAEMRDYVATACPLEITETMLRAMVAQLEAGGLLSGTRSACTPRPLEWKVHTPSSSSVRKLLAHAEVRPLLSPDVASRLVLLDQKLMRARSRRPEAPS